MNNWVRNKNQIGWKGKSAFMWFSRRLIAVLCVEWNVTRQWRSPLKSSFCKIEITIPKWECVMSFVYISSHSQYHNKIIKRQSPVNVVFETVMNSFEEMYRKHTAKGNANECQAFSALNRIYWRMKMLQLPPFFCCCVCVLRAMYDCTCKYVISCCFAWFWYRA